MATKVGILVETIRDSGYTKVCPGCAIRYGDTVFAAGRMREIELVRCRPCAVKIVEKKQRKPPAHLRAQGSQGRGHYPELSRNHSREL